MNGKTVIDILRSHLPDLRKRFGVKRIGVFGSVLTDHFSEQSDIDLVVEFDRPVGFAFFDLGDHLEDILGRKVDILTPGGVGSIRIREVADNIRESTVYV